MGKQPPPPYPLTQGLQKPQIRITINGYSYKLSTYSVQVLVNCPFPITTNVFLLTLTLLFMQDHPIVVHTRPFLKQKCCHHFMRCNFLGVELFTLNTTPSYKVSKQNKKYTLTKYIERYNYTVIIGV